MSRTGQQRLEAIEPALARREGFCARVKKADGDIHRCADLMAEAIQMEIDARGLDVVGKDGRVVVSIERVISAHCAKAAMEAYHRARGTNDHQ